MGETSGRAETVCVFVLAALPQPIEVQEIGGDSLLESLTGPALIAIAAIVAAFVAAYVARRNHAHQLDHDRSLRDLDHARQSIGAAVETITETITAGTSLLGAARDAGEAHDAVEHAESETDALEWYERGEDGEVRDTRTVEIIEGETPSVLREENDTLEAEANAIRAATDAVKRVEEAREPVTLLQARLLADTLRLRIAIGENSEVVSRHQDVVDALKSWIDTTRPDDDGIYHVNVTPDLNNPDVARVGNALAEFITACQRWSADQSNSKN
jgi:hypothetical protein